MEITDLVTFRTENEKWKQEIKDLEDKNIQFKTSLANLLANDESKYQIECLEHLQNRFLQMDEQLNLLKHDVREQLQLLQSLSSYSSQQIKDIRSLQLRLEVKIMLIREDFNKMAGEFDSFIINKTV